MGPVGSMGRLGDRFVLVRELGSGGMSRVFLGRDEVLDRPVAVKVVEPDPEYPQVGLRFQREGRAAARLSHPNIVRVFDAGEDKLEGREVSYIVMEYVPGGDLKTLLDKKGSLPSDELAGLGAEVASGLAHAHEKGVIHRDIKPHNILIDEHGRPKLTDFGIARALDATQATRTGSYLGTALYSSPEQLQGEKVTPKSDIYSLGMTLYQAAVGDVPFTGAPIEVASQHVSRIPVAPSDLGARLSDEVETLILDCINKDPDRRPSAEEVHERLREETQPARAYIAPPVSEPPPVEHTPAASPEEPPESPLAERTRTRTRTAPPETTPAGPSPGGVRREDDQGPRRRRLILFAPAVLLIVALGVAAAFAALGGGSSETAQNFREENQQVNSSGEESTPVQEQTTQGASAGGQGSSDAETAAAQAVEDFYTSAAEKDYERSGNLLTAAALERYFPSRDYFGGTFGTLRRIRFIEGPTAEVSGNTATVTGTTIAEHTDRTEQNTGTWTLVNEGGQWKLDSWD